jgi:PAS domain S-box-containing protein
MSTDVGGGDRAGPEPPPTGTIGDAPDAGGEEAAWDRLRYQELFEFALDCLLVTDFQGVILAANLAAVAHFRIAKEFLIGKPLGLLMAEGRRARFYECLMRLDKGARADEFETRTASRGDLRDVVLRAEVTGDEARNRLVRWAIRDVTERKRSESMRSDLIRRLLTAQEDERRRLARELHDSMGQELTAVMLSLKAVESLVPDSSPARTRLREMRDSVERIGRAVHDASVELRPTSLDDLGLKASLVDLVHRWSQRSGILVDLHASFDETERIPLEIETVVYRVVQEALTNVVKHADASRVSVILERREGYLIAIVEDDGRGFAEDVDMTRGRLGIVGMRERAILVGGSLQVESSADIGTTVRIRVPLKEGERE